MAGSESQRPNRTTPVPDELREIADLLGSVFCACRKDVRADIGTLACELFRRVDMDRQRLDVAADALGLDAREAEAILVVVRRNIASALVDNLSSGSRRNSRQ